MLSEESKNKIINGAIEFFKNKVIPNHIKNIQKASKLNAYKSHRFLEGYLSNFFDDKELAIRKAKALAYPRMLGSSITTSFGQNMQKFFTSFVLNDFKPTGSIGSGLDIEFIDQTDNIRKYCQLKAGPNTINKDDIVTICDHFKKASRLAVQNGVRIAQQDFVLGTIYGEQSELTAHYISISNQNYSVYAGRDFWTRLTGDINFYDKIIDAIASIQVETNLSRLLDEAVNDLAEEIRKFHF